MSPMTGDSGDTASALFAMFIIPVVGIILPLLITAKLLKKVRSLYDPRPDKNEYSSDVERTAMKLSKTVLMSLAAAGLSLTIAFPNVIKFSSLKGGTVLAK